MHTELNQVPATNQTMHTELNQVPVTNQTMHTELSQLISKPDYAH